jgi:hypothetical protein
MWLRHPVLLYSRGFSRLFLFGINMLGDAFRVLINPSLKLVETISVRGGIDYEYLDIGGQRSR